MALLGKKDIFIDGFECGAEDVFRRRLVFSVQFFIVSLVFIIFDLEVVFLINLFFCSVDFMLYLHFFVLFVLFTLFIELFIGVLS